jgi:4-amino-4-deoxy-L-arabinose transferase-like glycosyltransferase
MADPIRPDSLASRADTGRAENSRHWLTWLLSLPIVLELALAVRVTSANLVEWYVRRAGVDRICVFDDTRYYWELARTIRLGVPYEIVEWADIPHFALRTPGYPLVLAACQTAFGERPLAARLVQAVLGTVGVYLVYRLTAELTASPSLEKGRRWSPPLVAAAMAAFHPYSLFLSAILLSEAVFVPLMTVSLWGQAILWRWLKSPETPRTRKPLVVALASGAAAGAAVLVRPSWVLFIPLMLAVPLVATWRSANAPVRALRNALLTVVGFMIVMAPWWARNATIYGRFVPTALWMGASLYDGLNPAATGASDMTFLGAPNIWPLDEEDQDAELSRRALVFAREQPGRVLWLGLVKLARFWTPWPNADVLRSPFVAIAAALFELPMLGLIALGLWSRRGDSRAWVLLAGPLLYFCAIHLLFASSMRYRIPGEIPALALAAFGCETLISRAVVWRERKA